MIDENYKNKAKALIKKAKTSGKSKTYDEFSKTKKAKKLKLSEDEITYYTTLAGDDKQK